MKLFNKLQKMINLAISLLIMYNNNMIYIIQSSIKFKPIYQSYENNDFKETDESHPINAQLREYEKSIELKKKIDKIEEELFPKTQEEEESELQALTLAQTHQLTKEQLTKLIKLNEIRAQKINAPDTAHQMHTIDMQNHEIDTLNQTQSFYPNNQELQKSHKYK